MLFRSTRNKADVRTPSAAIVQGISEDGGLYVPEAVPVFDKSMRALAALNYRDLAYEVMKLYLTDFTEEELRQCIDNAYGRGFDTPEPVELVTVGNRRFLELYHGRTIAFKDMALSILPHLMVTAAKKNNVKDELVIVTATSGDTGKAAMAGFADVPNTRIIVFYPKDGVSPVQERQMVTQEGRNVHVIAIRGNFDDAQSAVKAMMEDATLRTRLAERGFRFSSANSINIGRLVPQIVYYVYAYTRLLAEGSIADGEEINITVPTGNFGNILAAHYARRMGLPVHKLICASNENKVLFDFFQSGTYDRNRPFHVTTSPSMDILISSNLERLIDELTDGDTKKTADYMRALASNGHYALDAGMREKLTGFSAGFADVERTAQRIRTVL
ncbi:MAG: threonine synthase, partial [Eubacteriales bacterium]|nr:threonine synthase [Eubacteriales bacterium]